MRNVDAMPPRLGRAMSRRALYWTLGLGGALALVLLAVVVLPALRRPSDGDAIAACHSFVAPRLAAPQTAQFAGPPNVTVVRSGTTGAYTVESFVAANDSRGEPLVIRYTCLMQWDRELGWTLLSLNLT